MRKIGEELERMHPSLYINVTRQITRPSNGELQTVDTAPAILNAIARDLFRSEITWSKVMNSMANYTEQSKQETHGISLRLCYYRLLHCLQSLEA